MSVAISLFDGQPYTCLLEMRYIFRWGSTLSLASSLGHIFFIQLDSMVLLCCPCEYPTTSAWRLNTPADHGYFLLPPSSPTGGLVLKNIAMVNCEPDCLLGPPSHVFFIEGGHPGCIVVDRKCLPEGLRNPLSDGIQPRINIRCRSSAAVLRPDDTRKGFSASWRSLSCAHVIS